jgi:hypothetical protein
LDALKFAADAPIDNASTDATGIATSLEETKRGRLFSEKVIHSTRRVLT